MVFCTSMALRPAPIPASRVRVIFVAALSVTMLPSAAMSDPAMPARFRHQSLSSVVQIADGRVHKPIQVVYGADCLVPKEGSTPAALIRVEQIHQAGSHSRSFCQTAELIHRRSSFR